MAWLPISGNPYWEYDNDPPDPGLDYPPCTYKTVATALWATGTNGIRTNNRGEEIYMNCRKIHPDNSPTDPPSIPNEISKTYWDQRA